MTQAKMDVALLLPSRGRIAGEILLLIFVSAAGGPLLAYWLSSSPAALPWLAALTWGLSLFLILSFLYAAWFFYRLWRAYHEQQAAQKMADFYRAIEGGSRPDSET